MKKLFIILMSILVVIPNTTYAKTEEETTIANNEETTTEEVTSTEAKTEIVTLEACVDGDTARFRNSNNEVIKARFLAVDTPETVHPTKGEEPYGKEASEFTCQTLTNAKEIKLEYDNNSNEEDNYGRKLVWVFVDGALIQESLVNKGYAEVAYLYDDYKYTSLLQDGEQIAKVSKLGIWSTEEVEEDTIEEVVEETPEEEKGFLNKLIDNLLGKIVDFVDEILESILKEIENML